MNDLQELIEWIPDCRDDIQITEKVWSLCNKHGKQVFDAIKRMRDTHDNLYQPIEEDSLLKLISEREYLKEPIERLVASIREKTSNAIPAMFRQNRPKTKMI